MQKTNYKEGMVILKERNQTVIKGSIARKLIKMGFNIVDVKPQRQENGTIDFTRCVFVFGAKEGLQKAVESLK